MKSSSSAIYSGFVAGGLIGGESIIVFHAIGFGFIVFEMGGYYGHMAMAHGCVVREVEVEGGRG